jgi:hypothetical protein
LTNHSEESYHNPEFLRKDTLDKATLLIRKCRTAKAKATVPNASFSFAGLCASAAEAKATPNAPFRGAYWGIFPISVEARKKKAPRLSPAGPRRGSPTIGASRFGVRRCYSSRTMLPIPNRMRSAFTSPRAATTGLWTCPPSTALALARYSRASHFHQTGSGRAPAPGEPGAGLRL